MQKYDVAIVGGGLSGLAAAAMMARAGRSTVLFERAGEFGGRAITIEHDGARFNLGAHSFYLGGPAERLLRDLGVDLKGVRAPAELGVVRQDGVHTLPGNPVSLLSSKLLSASGKVALVGLLMRLGKLDPTSVPRINLRSWAEQEIRDPAVRHLIYALCRVATYQPDPDRLPAAPALARLQRTLNAGVLYLEQGWGALVESLRQVAVRAGAELQTGAAVTAIERDGTLWGIARDGGERVEAHTVLTTIPPAAVAKLVAGAERTALAQWAKGAQPLYVACLDVALRRLPVADRSRTAAMFYDQPLFASTPTNLVKLGDKGYAVVQAIKHSGLTPGDPKADESQLEAALDAVQPGWRDELVTRRFLPRLIACNGVDAMTGGGPCGPTVPELPGLYVAGDWTAPDEVLADAAMRGVERAVDAALRGRPSLGAA